VTEWWQKDEGDVPVPIPRRDQVPEAGFSDPREVSAAPELARFVPEWRARRRIVACLVTVVSLAVIVWSLCDIFRLMSISHAEARAGEAGRFIGDFVQVAAAFVGIVLIWKWANRSDSRDLRRSRP
jgi:hypothetical protein